MENLSISDDPSPADRDKPSMLLNLPVEILSQVVEQCPDPTLKSLRLTNRALTSLASAVLFRTFTLPVSLFAPNDNYVPPSVKEDAILDWLKEPSSSYIFVLAGFKEKLEEWKRYLPLWTTLEGGDLDVLMENTRELVVKRGDLYLGKVHPHERSQMLDVTVGILNRLVKRGKRLERIDWDMQLGWFADMIDLSPLSSLTYLTLRWYTYTWAPYSERSPVSIALFTNFDSLTSLELNLVDAKHLETLNRLPGLRRLTFNANKLNILNFFEAQTVGFKLRELVVENSMQNLEFSDEIVMEYLSDLRSLTLRTPEWGGGYVPPRPGFTSMRENVEGVGWTCNLWGKLGEHGVKLRKVDVYAPLKGLVEYLCSYEGVLEEVNVRVRVLSTLEVSVIEKLVGDVWGQVVPRHKDCLRKVGIWPEIVPYVSGFMGEPFMGSEFREEFLKEIARIGVFGISGSLKTGMEMCKFLGEVEMGAVKIEQMHEVLGFLVGGTVKGLRRVRYHAEGFGKAPPPGRMAGPGFDKFVEEIRKGVLQKKWDITKARGWDRMRVEVVPLRRDMWFSEDGGQVRLADGVTATDIASPSNSQPESGF
ncbi:hypothetical protein H072_6614 [Dactylellina haptotyla CBS 200.50]|uniref:F-box domain-containing protein n=1 Tax=Dactylellina haptotyla (strain CBS 200.50) TaxID=1284197 RepID=S8BW26_DACHA|nr:hypothetical protein H072_6614 [Dactylellina haptotyla CBS 200.50]